jgi:leucyl/phenylalanyl-tRNA---protein transferase
MSFNHPILPWVEPGTPLPPPDSAWPQGTGAPGLVAAGADLSVATLTQAYAQGMFPWFNHDQPILWWSPDPRMVLRPEQFKISASFKKTLKKFIKNPHCELRVNHSFAAVIRHCAQSSRSHQSGTWIVPDMINAYIQLHHAGYAHSFETWCNGELRGGLYCVALGRAVFGESMFSTQSDASKIALAGLVAFCNQRQVHAIDCQQNTQHLASLGAAEMRRSEFLHHIQQAQLQTMEPWAFSPQYWQSLL